SRRARLRSRRTPNTRSQPDDYNAIGNVAFGPPVVPGRSQGRAAMLSLGLHHARQEKSPTVQSRDYRGEPMTIISASNETQNDTFTFSSVSQLAIVLPNVALQSDFGSAVHSDFLYTELINNGTLVANDPATAASGCAVAMSGNNSSVVNAASGVNSAGAT